MPIRMTGMVSGLDTESLVNSLVEAQQLKNKKTTDKKTKLEWTQEKWKDLNTKLYSFYTDKVGKMRLQSSYSTKKVSSSNENKLKVTANASAPLGMQTLTVSKLAAAGYMTGAKVSKDDGGTITSSTKMSELGITEDATLSLTTNGKTTAVEVTKDTTIADFVKDLKAAGVNANYDTTQKRFYISSKKAGTESDFSLTAQSDSGLTVLNKLGLVGSTLSDTEKASYEPWAKAAGITKDSDGNYTAGNLSDDEIWANIQSDDDLKAAYESEVAKRTTKYQDEKKSLEEQNTTLTDANKTLADKNTTLTNEISDLQAKYDKSTLESFKSDSAYADAVTAAQEEYEKLDLSGKSDEEKARELEMLQYTKIIEAAKKKLEDNPDDTTLSENIDKLTAASKQLIEIDDKYEEIETNKNTISENEKTITDNTSKITDIEAKLADTTEDGTGVAAEAKSAVIERAKKANEILANGTAATGTSTATKIDGANAEFNLNGVDYSTDSNEVSINGVSLTLSGTTEAGEILNFTVTNDVDAVYNQVKDFVKSYNEILDTMNTAYYAESASGYDPLSDDEKEAMTDDQIEKWETKIKDSLLRRDSTLGSITSAMRSAMLTTVDYNGKKYSLSSFGIVTSSDYTEKGKLHIKGDADDSTYASDTDKLKAALESDPDAVMEVLSGVMTKLYDTLSDKMKKTSNSSALTFYNDIYMKNQMIDLNKQIKKDEQKLSDLEDKYYKQFSAMETALAKLQSQQSSLSSLFGTGS